MNTVVIQPAVTLRQERAGDLAEGPPAGPARGQISCRLARHGVLPRP